MPDHYTPRLGLPYPDADEPADVPADLTQLVTVLDTLANMHAPGDLIVSAATTRAGCLLCDGTAISRANYPALFTAIGTTYGAGDGSSTFNVPDYRGRSLVAAGAGPGLTARTLNQKFGEENHVLSVAELASHNHGANTGQDFPDHTHTLSDPGHSHAYYHRDDMGSGTQTSHALVGWGVQGSTTYAATTGISIGGATGRHQHNIPSQGSNTGHNTVQPSVGVNVFIKT